MEPAAHITAVAEEGAAMAAALAEVPVDAAVPTCPAWNAHDLAVHAGLFCGFWTHVLCEGTGRPKPEVPDAPDGPATTVAGWFRDRVNALAQQLETTDPDTEVWTWSLDDEDHRAAFVARRAAHELAIHRVDAQLARGTAAPIDARLAADGIEEILMILRHWQRQGDDPFGDLPDDAQRISLRASDTEQRWRLGLARAGLQVERHDGDADVVLTGTTSDLEMVLYDRPTVGTVTREGTDEVLDTWRQAFTFT